MTHTATDAVVERARTGNRRAIEALFRDVYPLVRRVSRALCGEAGRAERVAGEVFRQALNVLPRWSAGADPENWFLHHTVQTSRRVRGGGRPPAGADLLVAALPPTALTDDPERLPAYAALVRGVRRLPPQQEEAFILHHGERLNPRLLGVAMDCSTQAAVTHLRAADQTIRELAGTEFDVLSEMLRRACAALSPEPEETHQFVRARVGAWAGRRFRRRFGRLLTLAILAGAAAYAWQHRGVIRDRLLPATSPATRPASEPLTRLAGNP